MEHVDEMPTSGPREKIIEARQRLHGRMIGKSI